MTRGLDMAHRRAPALCAPSWGAPKKMNGSLLEGVDTGNSNRVLGLFADLPKGVK
jgi:hypothetical protein